MSANQSFELEPESPADRQARKDYLRKAAVKSNRKRRQREAQQGLKAVTFSIPLPAIAAIDTFRERHNLPNRSAVMTLLLADRQSAEEYAQIRQELGL